MALLKLKSAPTYAVAHQMRYFTGLLYFLGNYSVLVGVYSRNMASDILG